MTTTNLAQISTAGAKGTETTTRAHIDQVTAERIGSSIGRDDITAQVFDACGRIIVAWSSEPSAWILPATLDELGNRHRAEAEIRRLSQELTAAGYQVTGAQSGHCALRNGSVKYTAHVAIAITPSRKTPPQR